MLRLQRVPVSAQRRCEKDRVPHGSKRIKICQAACIAAKHQPVEYSHSTGETGKRFTALNRLSMNRILQPRACGTG